MGETLRLLTGARLIADLDSRITSHAREEGRIEKKLEALSAAYGLASRRMALVAVVERAGDREGDVPKTVVVPVGMPQDTAFDAYFARSLPARARYVASPHPKMQAQPIESDLDVTLCSPNLQRSRRQRHRRSSRLPAKIPTIS